jgi:hypothetical protein
MGWYTDMTNSYTARQVIEMIANDYVELSHDKVLWQRDDHMRICKEWLKAHPEASDAKYSDIISDGGMDPR